MSDKDYLDDDLGGLETPEATQTVGGNQVDKHSPWYTIYDPYTDFFQATFTPLYNEYAKRWKELTVLNNGPATAYFTKDGDMVMVEIRKMDSSGFAYPATPKADINQVANRWRAEPFKKSSYWIITDRFGVSKTTDKDRSVDRLRYRRGNYFRSEEQAKDTARALQEVLRVIHLPLEYPETNPLNDGFIYAARRTPRVDDAVIDLASNNSGNLTERDQSAKDTPPTPNREVSNE